MEYERKNKLGVERKTLNEKTVKTYTKTVRYLKRISRPYQDEKSYYFYSHRRT